SWWSPRATLGSGPVVASGQGGEDFQDAFVERGQVVAALQDQHRTGADPADLAGHLAEVRRRQAEVAEGVVAVGIEAGRDDQEAGIETAEGRQRLVLERVLESALRRPGGKRNVHG